MTAPPAVTNEADAEPKREPRWRWLVKSFLITLAFTIIIDLGFRFLPLRAGKSNDVALAIKSFEQSVNYGLESVFLLNILSRGRARLKTNRYHTAVRNLKTPFNLSEACRNGEARAGVYGDKVSNLCYTPPPFMIYRDPLEFPRVPVLRIPLPPEVNAAKYPRSIVKENPLGLPDAIRYTLARTWEGKDYGNPVRTGRPPRSNWFGKLLLIAVLIFSLVFTFRAEKIRRGRPPTVSFFLYVFCICLLFYAGIACVVVVVAVKVLVFLGLLLSALWAALAGFPVAVWVFAALKDFAVDQAKDYVAKKV